MDCNPPGSSVHGIFQARLLEWGANIPAMQETLVLFLSLLATLEEGMATHSRLQYSCLENPMDKSLWVAGLSPQGHRVVHDWAAEQLSTAQKAD